MKHLFWASLLLLVVFSWPAEAQIIELQSAEQKQKMEAKQAAAEKFAKVEPRLNEVFENIENKYFKNSSLNVEQKATIVLKIADRFRQNSPQSDFNKFVLTHILQKLEYLYLYTHHDEKNLEKIIEENFSNTIITGYSHAPLYPTEKKENALTAQQNKLGAKSHIIGELDNEGSLSMNDQLIVVKKNGDSFPITPLAIYKMVKQEINLETMKFEPEIPYDLSTKSVTQEDEFVIFLAEDLTFGLSENTSYLSTWDFIGISK